MWTLWDTCLQKFQTLIKRVRGRIETFSMSAVGPDVLQFQNVQDHKQTWRYLVIDIKEEHFLWKCSFSHKIKLKIEIKDCYKTQLSIGTWTGYVEEKWGQRNMQRFVIISSTKNMNRNQAYNCKINFYKRPLKRITMAKCMHYQNRSQLLLKHMCKVKLTCKN